MTQTRFGLYSDFGEKRTMLTQRLIQRVLLYWDGRATRPASHWVAAASFVLAFVIFCMVLGILASQAFSASSVSNVPASPLSSSTPTAESPPQAPSPFVLVPFPTTTRIVTLTPPRPRTSTPRPRVAATATPFKYKVKTGDTLGSIAKKYRVTVNALIRANGLKSDSVHVGDVLIIPPASR